MESTSSSRQFGLMIAYVLPGFIGLAGLAPIVPLFAEWLRPLNQGDLGVGPPLYAVLAAMAIGSTLSCFRWILLDKLHQWTGVRRPNWDDRQLDQVLGGFDYLVQSHFRYYEFCGNTLLALLVAYGLNRTFHTVSFLGLGTDLAILIVLSVLFAASRDALAKYYLRTGRLVGLAADNHLGVSAMYNGNDHGGSSKKPSHPKPESQPTPTPVTPEKPQPTEEKASDAKTK
jgi:hypothetical protein